MSLSSAEEAKGDYIQVLEIAQTKTSDGVLHGLPLALNHQEEALCLHGQFNACIRLYLHGQFRACNRGLNNSQWVTLVMEEFR